MITCAGRLSFPAFPLESFLMQSYDPLGSGTKKAFQGVNQCKEKTFS